MDHDNCWIDSGKHPHLPYSVLVYYLFTIPEILEATGVYSGRIPEEMLPIGGNLGGDLILVGCSASAEGTYFWDHEAEDLAYEIIAEIPPLDRIQYFKVADSFSEFADMLEELP